MTVNSISLTDLQIEAAVAWWSERWEPDASRQQFADALRDVLRNAERLAQDGDLRSGNRQLLLHVDYDPQGILLIAVQRVVPTCRGCFFSADGLLPRKRRMSLGPGRVEVSDGRGAQWETIWEVA